MNWRTEMKTGVRNGKLKTPLLRWLGLKPIHQSSSPSKLRRSFPTLQRSASQRTRKSEKLKQVF
uniref:Uncharacterized protein n=1 Tax=Anguilla anguilla TaxID=7936 RepID=A0A0E9QX71_ANGAN